MIKKAFDILKDDLNHYLSSFDDSFSLAAVADNIARWEDESNLTNSMNDKIVMTLLRTEEEAIFKNLPHRTVSDNKSVIANPPAYLNLYILFSANYGNYQYALIAISKVIAFFTGKRVFTAQNTGYTRPITGEDEGLSDLRLVVNLYTPGFEELNNIWGVLGGKLLPAVCYKIQIVKIESDKKLGESSVVTTISGKLNRQQDGL